MPPKNRKNWQQESEEEEPSQSEDSSSNSSSGSEDEESGSDFPDVSDEDEEDSSGSEDDIQELQVEFEFFSPEEKDFLGLKSLLVPYLNGQEFDSSGLIEAIIAEGAVGSVVKTDSDDDPIALMSVLSTHKHKGAPFMQQIRQFLLDMCPKHADGLQLSDLCRQAFDSKGTGLILNDRFINAPPKLSPPLVMFLMEAIQERAQPGQPNAEHFQFKRFLLATRVYMDKGATTRSGAVTARHSSGEGGNSSSSRASKGDGGGRPAKKQKQEDGPSTSTPVPAAAEIIFSRPEDQYFHQFCSWYFTFPVESRPVGKDGLQQCRLVMQIDMDWVPAAQKVLDEEVGNMAKDGVDDAQDVAKMAEAAMEAAAAAGAGKGAGKKKKAAGGKAKAIQL